MSVIDVSKHVYAKAIAIIAALFVACVTATSAYLASTSSITNEFTLVLPEPEPQGPQTYLEWVDFYPEDARSLLLTDTTLQVINKEGDDLTGIVAIHSQGTDANGNRYICMSDEVYTSVASNVIGTALEGQRVNKLVKSTQSETIGDITYFYYVVEFGNAITTIEEEYQLYDLESIEPYHPSRTGYVFLGWTDAEYVSEDEEGNKYYKTTSRYGNADDDRDVTILWRDAWTTGAKVTFTRVGYGNATCELVDANGKKTTFGKLFNVGNDGSTEKPLAFAYFNTSVTEEDLQAKLIGAEATFVNAVKETPDGVIKDVKKKIPDDSITSGGATYYKYFIYYQEYPETTVNSSYLDKLREVEPYVPYREGYHFDGWSEPEQRSDDYYVVNALWSKIDENPDDMNLKSYAAIYGNNILVLGRGSVPSNFEGVALTKSWTDIEDLENTDIPWESEKPKIKEAHVVGNLKPNSIAGWFGECRNLVKVESLNKINFSGVEDASELFKNCIKLDTIDLADCVGFAPTNTTSMFEGCSSLTRIYVDDNWDNSKINASQNMFLGCSSLIGGNDTLYDSNRVDAEMAVIDNDEHLGYLSEHAEAAYAAIYGTEGAYSLVFGRGGLVPESYGNKNLVEYFRGFEEETYDAYTIPWKDYKTSITDVKFLEKISPASTAHWFNGFESMKSFTSTTLANLDTSLTTDFTSMFANCKYATTIDISKLNTSKVKHWNNMFYFCQSLTSVDLSQNSTASAVGMGTLFWECKGLTKINFGKTFNTKNVTAINGMFFGCESLTTLDLSMFDTRKVKTMAQLFSGCLKLKTIYASEKFVTSAIDKSNENNYVNIFASCKSLVGGDGKPCVTSMTDNSKWSDISYARIGNSSVRGAFTLKSNVISGMWGTCPWKLEGGTLTISAGAGSNINEIEDVPWLDFSADIVFVDISDEVKAPTTLNYMFYDCDTIQTMDLSGFDTSNVISSQDNFTGCSLTSMKLSAKTAAKDIFTGFADNSRWKLRDSDNPSCAPNELVDVVNENTEGWYDTSVHGLWGTCPWIIDDGTLIISSGTGTNITTANMAPWYTYRNSIKKVVTNGDVIAPSYINNMFSGYMILESADLATFNLSRTISTAGMFQDCSSLIDVDLSGANTNPSRLYQVSSMFYGCEKLESIDLSTFNTIGVDYANNMFANAKNVNRIHIGLHTLDGIYLQMSFVFSKGDDEQTLLTAEELKELITNETTGWYNVVTPDMWWGSCPIMLRAGVMTIYAGKGSDFASGTSYNNQIPTTTAASIPWYTQRTLIKEVVFKDGVIAPGALYWMFYGCTNLESIDFSGFDTSNVVNTWSMFHGCSSLASLDLSKFDTSNVKDMRYMFYDCSELTSIDLSSFDTSKVTNMSSVFYECSKLSEIKIGPKTFAKDIFTGLSSKIFVSKDGKYGPYTSSQCATKITTENAGWYDILVGGTWGSCSWEIIDGVLTIHEGTGSNINSYSGVPWYTYRSSITEVVISENVVAPAYISYMFYNCKNLTSLDLSGFDTSNAITMRYMLYNCSSLTSLDLSGFDTSNVTDMQGMFEYCSSLNSLDLSGFGTSNVTNMSYMFRSCNSLISLDLSGFDTSNVTTMCGMFNGCSSLTSLDLSGLDTSNVTTMYEMFDSCINLTSLDLSGFDTSNVINMTYMFYKCSSLTSLDLSRFDTSNVTSMSSVFSGCNKLSEINIGPKTFAKDIFTGLSNKAFKSKNGVYGPYSSNNCASCITEENAGWYDVVDVNYWGTCIWYVVDGVLTIGSGTGSNISSNTSSYVPWYSYRNSISEVVISEDVVAPAYVSYMFYGMTNLVKADLSGFDTSKATSMTNVFYGCNNLSEIKIGIKTFAKDIFTGIANQGFISQDGQYGPYLAADCATAITEENAGWYDVINSWGTCRWDIVNGVLTIHEGTGADIVSNSSTYIPWYSSRSSIKEVVISENVIAPSDISYMFYGMTNLTKVDLSGMTTPELKSMYHLFYNCSKLETLDISNFDTSIIENTIGAVHNCSSLKSIKLGPNSLRKSAYWLTSIPSIDSKRFVSRDGLLPGQYTPGELAAVLNADTAGWYDIVPVQSSWGTCLYTESADGVLTVGAGKGVDVVSSDSLPWADSRDTYRLVEFNATVVAPNDISGLFNGYSALTAVDLTNLDTTNTTVCSDVFTGSPNIETVIVGEHPLPAEIFKSLSGSCLLSETTGELYEIATLDGSTLAADTYTVLDQAPEVTLTYVSDGITLDSLTTTLLRNESFTVAAMPKDTTKEGHAFIGWSYAPEATDVDVLDGESVTLSEDTTLFAVWQEKSSSQLIDEYIDSMTLREKVSQMFNVFPENLASDTTSASVTTYSDSYTSQLEEYPWGGVTLFLGNIKSESQAKALTSALQSNSSIPMLIGVDEEGGRVQRIGGTTYDGAVRGAGIGYQLNAMQTYASEGTDTAYTNGYKLADNCLRIGCNWDFAPVADTNSNPNNPIIGQRAYSTDYNEAANLISAAIDGFHDHGVATSIKHFPGHGDTATDTHTGAGIVNKTYEELLEQDLIPFKQGIAAGTDSVMVGHLTIPAVDPDNFASVSRIWITDILRGELGYNGIVVTDGLGMGAVTKVYGTDEAGHVAAVLKCLDAGVDVFLLPGHPRACVAAIEAGVVDGSISEERINESVQRILELKYKLGLLNGIIYNAPGEPQMSAAGAYTSIEAYFVDDTDGTTVESIAEGTIVGPIEESVDITLDENNEASTVDDAITTENEALEQIGVEIVNDNAGEAGGEEVIHESREETIGTTVDDTGNQTVEESLDSMSAPECETNAETEVLAAA